jgi:hypothetical protein
VPIWLRSARGSRNVAFKRQQWPSSSGHLQIWRTGRAQLLSSWRATNYQPHIRTWLPIRVAVWWEAAHDQVTRGKRAARECLGPTFALQVDHGVIKSAVLFWCWMSLALSSSDLPCVRKTSLIRHAYAGLVNDSSHGSDSLAWVVGEG